ncbi:MAG: type I DNA topoisomerase, partial [bacterium]|nr:type I DNA topoisomerase [bacterium]
YVVKSSFGHIRDLPKSNLGIDVEHDFTPRYVVPTRSRKAATDLRKSAAKADTIIFATDEDREGEAISWHLKELFAKEIGEEFNTKKLERIAFHEITEEAIRDALAHPRSIDLPMVDAQQARRILDRLVGYELSPLLWQKIARGLSAGRVQSVALRLIVEREREIQAFKPEEYWTIDALFSKPGNADTVVIPAKLTKIGDEALEKFSIKTEAYAQEILAALANATFSVVSVNAKMTSRAPSAPYTTSTLQQDANRKLGFSAKQTMVIAQQLYEGIHLGTEGSAGLITYMRTDSVNMADRFVAEARELLVREFGAPFIPEAVRKYKARSKLAQEAHEAVRPTLANRSPESIKEYLEPNQLKLYELIWRRALASQMEDAKLETTSADILGADRYTFHAAGTRIAFEGFMAMFPDAERPTELPALAENEPLEAQSILPKQHFTEPPARFSDASLVKILEEHGIGRPSTYAPTIATLIDRHYAERIEGRRLQPTEVAFMVTDLLVEHFPNIVDYEFTAKMEESLDDIAEGKQLWVPVIRTFYEPFAKVLAEKKQTLVEKETTLEATDEVCEKCGKPMAVKFGRFGKFLACTGFPECRNTKSLGGDKGGPQGTGVTCPKCSKGEIIGRRSKKGRMFWGCNSYPDCNFVLWKKPTGEKCAACSSLMVFGAKEKILCSNKECLTNAKQSAPKEPAAPESESPNPAP